MKHRSAYSAAECVLQHDGIERLQSRIADALGQALEIRRVIPEYEQRFDKVVTRHKLDLGGSELLCLHEYFVM